MSPTGQLPYYHALINPRVSFDLFAFGKQLMKLRVLPHYMDGCPKLRVTSGLDGELECSKDNWDQLRSLLRQKRVKKGTVRPLRRECPASYRRNNDIESVVFAEDG